MLSCAMWETHNSQTRGLNKTAAYLQTQWTHFKKAAQLNVLWNPQAQYEGQTKPQTHSHLCQKKQT